MGVLCMQTGQINSGSTAENRRLPRARVGPFRTEGESGDGRDGFLQSVSFSVLPKVNGNVHEVIMTRFCLPIMPGCLTARDKRKAPVGNG
ncbi:hypothetical protein SKAU_G00140900 [Synaphobranchus kaupii]|uniref:Uncharacterized protein n=1 Tax=Synaphobranchus kaupii TaxID=118154 RepID=A0A9Q1FSL8_SYNKA|nr:hypothetical protein SKAU_G00140900 [Synaphobranchus kaupii]